jgi:hypothetical protein
MILHVDGVMIDKNNDDNVCAEFIFQTNKSLTWLGLSESNIKDAGVVALGEALKNNASLKTLILTSSQMGDDGALALADGFKVDYN